MKKVFLNKKIIIRNEDEHWLIFNPKNGAMLKLDKATGERFNNIKEAKCPNVIVNNLSKKSLMTLLKEGFIFEHGAKKQNVIFNSKKFIKNTNWIVGPQIELRSKISPIGILWEITNKCNLHCVYCLPNAKEKRLTGQDLSLEELSIIADNIIRSKICRVTMSGGEALLRKTDMFSIARKLKTENVMVGTISNGVIIDEKLADEIKELGILMGISLDAPNEKINSITRGKGVFKKSLNAIKLLKKKNIPFNVITTVTNKNFDHLFNLFKLLDEIGVTNIGMQDLKPSNPYVYEKFRLNRAQELRIRKVYNELKARYPHICFNDNEVRIFSQHLYAGNEENKQIMRCQAGTIMGYINSEGNMYPCTSLKMLKMGNALENDITDMWQNSEAMKKLKEITSNTTDILKGCSSECPIKKSCDGGCRGEAYYLLGDWNALHPRCLKVVGYETRI